MSKRLTTSEFKERLHSLYGDRFELLSEYVNNETKVLLRCNKCGNIIQKKPVKMTGSSREGCYICAGKNHYKTSDVLQAEVDEKYPGVYEVLGKYVGARTPILVRRIPCGHEYEVSPDNLLRGKGCPRCGIRQSQYMDIVEDYLSAHNIAFVKEKRFDDCRNILTLPFDYYIPEMNVCIEVDGEFHYQRNCACISRSSEYEKIAHRDAIKTEYCKQKNIKLIRLPYFEKDHFGDILSRELHVNTEITR